MWQIEILTSACSVGYWIKVMIVIEMTIRTRTRIRQFWKIQLFFMLKFFAAGVN